MNSIIVINACFHNECRAMVHDFLWRVKTYKLDMKLRVRCMYQREVSV